MVPASANEFVPDHGHVMASFASSAMEETYGHHWNKLELQRTSQLPSQLELSKPEPVEQDPEASAGLQGGAASEPAHPTPLAPESEESESDEHDDILRNLLTMHEIMCERPFSRDEDRQASRADFVQWMVEQSRKGECSMFHVCKYILDKTTRHFTVVTEKQLEDAHAYSEMMRKDPKTWKTRISTARKTVEKLMAFAKSRKRADVEKAVLSTSDASCESRQAKKLGMPIPNVSFLELRILFSVSDFENKRRQHEQGLPAYTRQPVNGLLAIGAKFDPQFPRWLAVVIAIHVTGSSPSMFAIRQLFVFEPCFRNGQSLFSLMAQLPKHHKQFTREVQRAMKPVPALTDGQEPSDADIALTHCTRLTYHILAYALAMPDTLEHTLTHPKMLALDEAQVAQARFMIADGALSRRSLFMQLKTRFSLWFTRCVHVVYSPGDENGENHAQKLDV